MENTGENFPNKLFDLMFFPGYSSGSVLDELAAKAEPEEWDFANIATGQGDHSGAPARGKPILDGYLRQTYMRLAEEGKIAITPDQQHIAFNTGLVTPMRQEIFAYGTPNRKEDARQPWYFVGWRMEGERDMSPFGSPFPAVANYFPDPSALVFDYRKPVHPNIEHIMLGENRTRFPEPYATQMPDFQLQNMLEGAINAAVGRAKRNYKTAVPQYYNHRDYPSRIQLLLPICLTEQNKADLALVIDDQRSYYRAATCLTLDMAYNNARLLARPDGEWLRP